MVLLWQRGGNAEVIFALCSFFLLLLYFKDNYFLLLNICGLSVFTDYANHNQQLKSS